MGAVRIQAILHTVDNVPANYLTNSWCFDGTDPLADATAVEAALDAFYTTWWASYAGRGMAQTGHEFKWYDLPGVVPNYPIRQSTWATGALPSSEEMPSEVSLVLSFQGQKVPGFPQSRRRGRIYLGSNRVTQTDHGRPAAAMVTAMTAAAATFKAAIGAIASDTTWAVWSQADGAAVPIDNGWIDNVWDTQRRRGLEVSSRTTFS